MVMRFSVNLDDFRGPLDLLLYLVRKHELDDRRHSARPHHRPVSRIHRGARADRRRRRRRLPRHGQHADRDQVADGAARRGRGRRRSSKTRAASWSAGCSNTSSTATPPACSKNAAANGASASRGWPATSPRGRSSRTSSRSTKSSCGTWSARSAACSKRSSPPTGPTHIRYDDTPIHVFMQRIDARLRSEGRVRVRRLLRRGGPQVDADRHVPGRAGTDAVPTRQAAQPERVRRNLARSRRRRRCRPSSRWSTNTSMVRRRAG